MLKRIDISSGPVSVQPSWRRQLVLSAFAIALAAALAGAAAPRALAADDEEDSLETKIIKGIFGINDRASIDYRERPPLVVPPNINNLPSPEANNLVNNAAWPKDPEIVERKRKREAKKQPQKSVEEQGQRLTPAELEAGRKVGAGRLEGPSDEEGRRRLRPDELGTKGNILGTLFKDTTKPDVATFSGEPSRSDLTQPPTGYRTPSPSHPYGLSPKREAAKPYDWFNKRGTE